MNLGQLRYPGRQAFLTAQGRAALRTHEIKVTIKDSEVRTDRAGGWKSAPTAAIMDTVRALPSGGSFSSRIAGPAQWFNAALAEEDRHDIDELRAEETELIDHAVNSLMSIATDNTTSPKTRVEAWSAIRRWAERKARLHGLDAPKTQAVLTLDAIDAQIATLEAELGVRAALEEEPGMGRLPLQWS